MIKKHSVSLFPSVSSFVALRRLPPSTRPRETFLGIGNPIFANASGTADSNTPGPAIGSLAALPETAGELRRIAQSLEGRDEDLLIGQAASESALKSMSQSGKLQNYKVIAFATHGLLAGELANVPEPAIALSSPRQGELDDGMLTASESAQLKLDADWVILSACNTAAGQDREGQQALSGLARAFFYAGARSLLVSHWRVDSAAAVKLTTGLIAAMKSDSSMGRPEALRRTMLQLIEGGAPYEAHPAYWAPFFVVGD